MQRAWLGIIVACVLPGGLPAALAGGLPFPVDAASYLIQVDGRTHWEVDAERRLPTASLTKVMTALLVLERYNPQEVVTVSRAAARESGSRLGLKPGERMRMRELLAASLLKSANDACHALAEHVSGSEKEFVQLMNRRAAEWGLKSTHFTNACGHDDARHRSSARDLAALAGRAISHPVFAGMVAVPGMTVQNADASRSFVLENRNALIGRYDGAIGIKSGYTPGAGRCLIAMAQRDGVRVLLVLLNASNRWWDASDILDYVFSQVNARHGS